MVAREEEQGEEERFDYQSTKRCSLPEFATGANGDESSTEMLKEPVDQL